ncbi:MAG: hypothetical protein HOG49_43805, partial [Candidatus Scalindua sp.]|nr:hypothetical protein [Candidatus Scalindua sp.]
MTANYGSKLSTLALFASLTLFNAGCASKSDKMVIAKPITTPSATLQGSSITSESDFISMLDKERDTIHKFSKQNVIQYESDEILDTSILPHQILVEMYPSQFINEKLGTVIDKLVGDIEELSLIVEPGVDINAEISYKHGTQSVYTILKTIVESAGYALKYEEDRNMLIISPYLVRKYFLPSGLFLQKTAGSSVGLGSATGNLEINSEPLDDLFTSQLKLIGSKDKIVNFSKDTG